MHDANVHVDRPCPNCSEERLQFEVDNLGCDACEASWSWADLLDELSVSKWQVERVNKAFNEHLRVHTADKERIKVLDEECLKSRSELANFYHQDMEQTSMIEYLNERISRMQAEIGRIAACVGSVAWHCTVEDLHDLLDQETETATPSSISKSSK